MAISTFAGGISNSGTITVADSKGGKQGIGIFVAGGSSSSAFVTISTFAGGIANSGTISAATGIVAFGVSTFLGGISNGGTIMARHTGIVASEVPTFLGDISNSGTITVTNRFGILVGGSCSCGLVSISSFAGNISNSGTISAGTGISVSYVSAFAGNISNSGTISALATGIKLFGVSTFMGNVSNSGTITAGSGMILAGISTFTGNVSNSGTITAGGNGMVVADLLTFAGNISNSGTITGSGNGILVSSMSVFAGNVSNSGTITTAVTGILVSGMSTFAGNLSNSGTITAGTGIVVEGVSTFTGNISNSGTITAANTGIFICNCVTFAGGAIVNTGTISGATGILIHNFSPVSIFDSGTIVGTGGTAIDLTQASGGNTFTLGPGYSITGQVLAFPGGGDTFQLGGSGNGSFDLSSIGPAQQYQNFTAFNVVSGIWTVSNTFGQSQAWNVNAGATLAGTGTLASLNVNSGGTLEPGTIGVPGTFMTITGNLAFQSGASYIVNISSTAASRANVSGAVTLNGSVLGLLTPGSYSGKTSYDILDPPSISGQFTGFTSNVPGLAGTLTYTPNEVLLNLTAMLGSGGGLNPAQQNVATGINNYFNGGGTLPAGFFPLFNLTGPGLANTLSLLDGEAGTDAQKGAFQLMSQYLDLLLDSTIDGRGGGPGGMSSFAPEQRAGLPPDVALAFASVHKAPDLMLKAAPPPRWTAWAADFGGYNQANGDPSIGSNNVIARDNGYAAGMDYLLSPDAVAGFSLAGGGTNWGLAQGFGGGRSDAFMAGMDGRVHSGSAYLGGALAFADHWFTTNRSALGDQLTARFNGQSYGARVEAGYRQAMPAGAALIGITPYAALQAQLFHTPTYSETDLSGGGFGLSYAAMSATDTRSELGARFDSLTAFNGMPLLLRGRLAWAHDWVSTPALSAAFQALPGSSFLVNGAPAPANSALTSIGGDLKITPSWSLRAKFDGEFAPGSQTYSATGTLRHQW